MIGKDSQTLQPFEIGTSVAATKSNSIKVISLKSPSGEV